MIIGTPKECSTTMIASCELLIAINKQYKNHSKIRVILIITLKNTRLIVLTLRGSYFIAVVNFVRCGLQQEWTQIINLEILIAVMEVPVLGLCAALSAVCSPVLESQKFCSTSRLMGYMKLIFLYATYYDELETQQ
jgi:hypothetical protein